MKGGGQAAFVGSVQNVQQLCTYIPCHASNICILANIFGIAQMVLHIRASFVSSTLHSYLVFTSCVYYMYVVDEEGLVLGSLDSTW